MGVPHPIPYQGSKRALAQTIIACLPADSTRLVEPFAGSAAVSLAAAYAGKANTFLLNDINAPLMALWDAILDRPDEIADGYERLWQEQQGRECEYYDWVRAEFNRTHRPDYFLYLLARCVKAAVRYNADGEFNQSPDNRRKGARPGTMRSHVRRASHLLRGRTVLTSGDYRQTLAMAAAADVIYMDPPYQGVCASGDPRYLEGVAFDEFVDALAGLNARQIAYIVSYDGRTGVKTFGSPLPNTLCLKRLEIDAGRSSQATLLGRTANTYESLYLSPALVARLDEKPVEVPDTVQQLPLFEAA